MMGGERGKKDGEGGGRDHVLITQKQQEIIGMKM